MINVNPKKKLQKLKFKLLLVFTVFTFYVSLAKNYASNHQLSVAFAGKDTILVCQSSFELNGSSLDLDEIGQWQVISGTGSLLDNSSPITTITGLVPGNVVLVWQVTNTLTSAFTEDEIVISNVLPTPASVGAGTITCSSISRIVGNMPIYGKGVWHLVSGSANILQPNLPISTVNGLGFGRNIFSWTISAGSCSSTATVSVNFNRAIAGTSQTICGNSITLNATPSSVNSGIWTLRSPITGNPLTEPNIIDDSDPSTLVTNIMPGTNIFRWTTRNFVPNSCISFSEITIISDTVNQAFAGNDAVICSDSLILNGNIPMQGLGGWSVLTSSSAIVINQNSYNSKVRNLSKGYNVLEWKIQKGNCITKDTLTIRNDSPSTAVVMADALICSKNLSISALSPIQGTGEWYTISGFATIANPNLALTSVSNLGNGDILLGWKTSFGACPSKRDTLKITTGVFEKANAGADFTICGDTALVTGNTVPGVGFWRILTGTGVVLNPTNYKSKIYNISINGILALEWQFAITGCVSSKDTIYIRRDYVSVANAGLSQIVCTSTATLFANNPSYGIGNWSLLGGSGVISNATLTNPTVSNLNSGQNIFQWSINSSFCNSISTVSINFNKAVAGLNQELCDNWGQLGASTPSVNSGNWTLRFPNTGNLLNDPILSDDTDEESYVFFLKPGKNIFRWTTRNVSPNSCSSFAEVTITNNAINTADAGEDATICADSLILEGNIPTQGIGTWSILTSTSAVITNQNLYNSKIKSLSEGLNVLEWKIQKGNCISVDTIFIRNDSPSKATVGSDLSICTGATTITAQVPTQGTGNWFNITGIGNIDSPNSAITSVSGLGAGEIKIGWKTKYANCPDKIDTLKITRFISIPANAGMDKQICGDSLVLSGNSVTGNGFWRILTGTGLVMSPTIYNSKIKNISVNGITILEWQFRTPGCSFTRDTIEITRDFVSPSLAGPNQVLCVNFANLNANNPQFGTGTWSVVSGGGTINNINNFNTSIGGLSPNMNILRWEISSTYCSSISLLTITNNMPTTAVAGNNKIICSTTDTLKSNIVNQGILSWQLLTGTGFILNPNNNISLVNNLGFGNNIFRISITKAACISRDTLILNNNLPDIALTNNDTILCVDYTKANANNPKQGTGQWVLASGSISISDIFNPKADFTNIAKGQNNIVWSVTSGICNANRDTLKIYNYSVNKPTTSGTNCTILTGNSVTSIELNSSDLSFGETSNWAIFPGGSYGFFPNNTASNITVSGVGRGFYRMVRDVFDSFGGTCRNKDTVLVSVIPKSLPSSDQCIKANATTPSFSTNLTSTNILNVGFGENGFWNFDNSINGNSPFPSVNSNSGVALGLRKGVHLFSYNVRNINFPSCVSKETMKVTILTEAEAGPNQCIKDVSELQPLVPNVGNPINPLVGGQFAWSAAGPAQINPSTGNTNNLVIGRNKFYLTNFNTNSSCSNIDSVFVTLVTNPNAGFDSSLVANPNTNYANSLLIANAPNTLVGESATWSVANFGSSSSSPNAILSSFINPNTQVQQLISGVNEFVWQINNIANGCSFRDTVRRNVISQARVNAPFYVTNSNPTVPLSFTLSALNSAPTTLRTARGEVGNWELIDFLAVNPPSSVVGSNPNTIQLSDVRRGVFNFRWTISNVSFPGFVSTANISITVLTKARAGNPYCINSINNLILGNSPTIPIRQLSSERYYWTSNDPNINISQIPISLQTSTDNIPSATISNIPIGKTKMYLHIQNITSGFEDIDSVQITKLTKADIGFDKEICVNTVQLNSIFNINTSVGESFLWERTSGKGTFDQNILEPIVIGLDTGRNVFRLEIINSGCKNADTIKVDNIGPYLATVGGVPISCFTTNYFDGNNPKLQFPTATGRWNLLSQPTFSNAIMVDNTATKLQVKDMIRTGTYKFNFVVSNKSCSITSDTLFVQRQNSISGNAGPNVSICKDSYIMQGSYPSIAGVSGEWKLIGGGGNINGINKKNATITGIPNDDIGFQNTFEWKVTLGECSSTYNVIISNFTPPSIASILGLNQLSFCQKDTIKLTTGFIPSHFVGKSKWTTLQGNVAYDSTTRKFANITFLGFGTNKLMYEVENSAFCPISRDTITIQRYQKATQSFAGINQKVCADFIKLDAQTPEVGFGKWYLTSATSPLVISDLNNPKSKIENVPPGEYFFKWKTSNITCNDSSFTQVTVRAPISKPKAQPIDNQCDTTTINISGNLPTNGTNVWRGPYLVNGTTVSNIIATNSKILDSLSANTKLSLKTIGKKALIYAIKDDFCLLSDTIYIQSYPAPSAITLTKDTLVCSDSILINVQNPTFGVNKFIINTVSGLNIFIQNTTQLGIANLPYGISTFIYKIEQMACPANIQTVTIANYKIENIFAGNDTLICIPTLELKAQKPSFDQGFWQVIKGEGNFINSDNTIPNAKVSNLSQGVNILKWTVKNEKCPLLEDILTITNNKIQSLAPFEKLTIFNANATLEAPNPKLGIGYWTTVKSNAIIENPNNNNTTARGLDVGENIFRWTVSIAGCNSESSDLKIVLNDIIVPQLISPNNDNFNQSFEIFGLDKYPNSKLEIFNKWGKSVYMNSNYDNSWQGQNYDAQPLADDTYTYVLTSKEGKVIKKDFVTIKR